MIPNEFLAEIRNVCSYHQHLSRGLQCLYCWIYHCLFWWSPKSTKRWKRIYSDNTFKARIEPNYLHSHIVIENNYEYLYSNLKLFYLKSNLDLAKANILFFNEKEWMNEHRWLERTNDNINVNYQFSLWLVKCSAND